MRPSWPPLRAKHTRRRAQRPVILNQMENGIAVRIAVLEKVIG
jgi:aspartate carbamoyltransferase catalytic subunit